MKNWLEQFIARRWNRAAARRPALNPEHGLDLGARLLDGDRAPGRITIPQGRRAQHIGCLGMDVLQLQFQLVSSDRKLLKGP